MIKKCLILINFYYSFYKYLIFESLPKIHTYTDIWIKSIEDIKMIITNKNQFYYRFIIHAFVSLLLN